MLPVEKGKGQLFIGGKFLCDVAYDISAPLHVDGNPRVQRILLDVPDEHCATLLNAYNLTLVLADGRRLHIPRPLQLVGLNGVECYVEID
jgi:hypothetical protein